MSNNREIFKYIMVHSFDGMLHSHLITDMNTVTI